MILSGPFESNKCFHGYLRFQMDYLVPLGFKVGEERGHRGSRGPMDVVQQHYAPATPLKTQHHSANYFLRIARSPVERVDVDVKLRDVAATQVVSRDPRVA